MKIVVTKRFKDKESKKLCKKGDVIIVKKERGQEIIKKGYAKEVVAEETKEDNNKQEEINEEQKEINEEQKVGD